MLPWYFQTRGAKWAAENLKGQTLDVPPPPPKHTKP